LQLSKERLEKKKAIPKKEILTRVVNSPKKDNGAILFKYVLELMKKPKK